MIVKNVGAGAGLLVHSNFALCALVGNYGKCSQFSVLKKELYCKSCRVKSLNSY